MSVTMNTGAMPPHQGLGSDNSKGIQHSRETGDRE